MLLAKTCLQANTVIMRISRVMSWRRTKQWLSIIVNRTLCMLMPTRLKSIHITSILTLLTVLFMHIITCELFDVTCKRFAIRWFMILVTAYLSCIVIRFYGKKGSSNWAKRFESSSMTEILTVSKYCDKLFLLKK